MIDIDWLQQVKPGDVVATGSGWQMPTPAKVEKLTATQIVLVGGRRYRRRDGRAIGAGSWGAPYLYPMTAELREQIQDGDRRRRALAVIYKASWREQPTDVLEAVAAALGES